MSDKAILVIGAGDATGGAIARRFAREGYIACVTRRTADKLQPLVEQIRADGGEAHAFGSDARKEEAMVSLVETIERDIAPIEVAVFNIGANVRFGITETTARVYQKVWEMACFSGFLMGRETAKVMLPRGHGTIIFTGATASVRGREGFAAFAGAKHALRALAQSMARELWPKNIHVAHTLIDGAIDTEWIRSNFPETLRDEGPAGHPQPGQHRRGLLADPPAAARRLVARDRAAAVDGELVSRAARCPARPTPRPEPLMQPVHVQFLFDFGSPNAYLCHKVIPAIEARTGAVFEYVPILLGGLFKLANNRAPMVAFAGIPNKLAYERLELTRFVARHGLSKYRFNPHFPVNTLKIMRGACAAQKLGCLPAYLDVVYAAMWEDGKNMDDLPTITATLDAGGLDSRAILAMSQDPEVKAMLGGQHPAGARPTAPSARPAS